MRTVHGTIFKLCTCSKDMLRYLPNYSPRKAIFWKSVRYQILHQRRNAFGSWGLLLRLLLAISVSSFNQYRSMLVIRLSLFHCSHRSYRFPPSINLHRRIPFFS